MWTRIRSSRRNTSCTRVSRKWHRIALSPWTAVRDGDFVVARDNFGCGSSREQAPAVLKALGVRAVFANSFARIFFRNAINIGLPVIVCEGLIDKVKPGEELSLDMESGTVCVNGQSYRCTKLPPKMQAILDQGGLIAALNREEA